MKRASGMMAFLLVSLAVLAQETKNPVVKSEPLLTNAVYIIDGKKILPEPNQDPKNKYTNISSIVNPMDIESINVIKGEQAIKTYGEEGRNGVVLITTRKTSQPLYIVDGLKESAVVLSTLDPAQIYKIEVLKGDQAQAEYGESGKNGVVLITTKKYKSKSAER